MSFNTKGKILNNGKILVDPTFRVGSVYTLTRTPDRDHSAEETEVQCRYLGKDPDDLFTFLDETMMQTIKLDNSFDTYQDFDQCVYSISIENVGFFVDYYVILENCQINIQLDIPHSHYQYRFDLDAESIAKDLYAKCVSGKGEVTRKGDATSTKKD